MFNFGSLLKKEGTSVALPNRLETDFNPTDFSHRRGVGGIMLKNKNRFEASLVKFVQVMYNQSRHKTDSRSTPY